VSEELFGQAGSFSRYMGLIVGRASRLRRHAPRAHVGAFFESLEERQLLSLTVDVRAADDVSKSATVAAVGETLNLDVWATITGKNANPAQDALQDVFGSFLSTGVTTGDVAGNLVATNAAPFGSTGAQPGVSQDLNGDGNKDVGSNDTTSSSAGGYFFSHSGSLEFEAAGTAVGGSLEFKIATLTYTVTNLNQGGETDITFRPRAGTGTFVGAVWDEDGTFANNLNNTVQGGAPFKISDPAIAPAPTAVNDSYEGVKNTASTLNVLTNDVFVEPADLTTVTVVNAPAHGSAVPQTGGSILYTPLNGFTGSDSFTYTVADSTNKTSNVATVNINVLAAARPAPVADAVTTQLNTADDINVLANDTVASGATITSVAIAAAPTQGTAVVQSDNTILYTPNAGYNGTDTFTYNETDSNGESSATPATVTVTVADTARPTAGNVTATTPPNVATDINVLSSDTPALGTTLVPSSVAVVSNPADGTAVVKSDGTILYTPNANFAGSDSFTYTVNQSTGQTSNTATVSIAVQHGNPPTANNDRLTALANTANSLNVLANDTPTSGNTLAPTTVVIDFAPEHGTAVAQTDGTILYTPTAGYVGVDSLQYTVGDSGGGISNAAQVNINVGWAITTAKGATRTLNYTEDDGAVTTITLNKGTAGIFFNGSGTLTTLKGGIAVVKQTPGIFVGFTDTTFLTISNITLTGTTKASALSIQSKHGSATIGGISDSGVLGSITAPTANLTGVLTVSGASSITLGQVTTGSLLSIGATGAGVTLALGTVADSTIDSAVPIRLLKLKSWTNTLGDGQNIKAPSIGSIVDNGAFEPDVTLSGAAKPAIPTLASANIHGALDGGTWTITGNTGSVVAGTSGAQWTGNISGKLNSFVVRAGGYSGAMTIGGILGTMSVIGNQAGTLTALSARAIHITGNMIATFITLTGTSGIDLGSLIVNGAIGSNSSVTADSSINSIVAGSLVDSVISAGIVSGTTLGSANSSTLGSSFIRGVHLTTPVKKGFAFSNSAIMARTINSAVVGKVNTSNGFTPEGLAAVIFKAVTGTLNGGTAHLGPKQLVTEADVTAFFSQENVITGDFEIDVVT
jgi:Bacterial Ig domain